MRSVVVLAVALGSVTVRAQIPSDRIAHTDQEPSSWLTYSGNYQSHRFSPLTQIDRQNVARLKVAWVYQVRRTGIVETSPIVGDGVMYLTEPPSTVTAGSWIAWGKWAIRLIWSRRRALRPCRAAVDDAAVEPLVEADGCIAWAAVCGSCPPRTSATVTPTTRSATTATANLGRRSPM